MKITIDDSEHINGNIRTITVDSGDVAQVMALLQSCHNKCRACGMDLTEYYCRECKESTLL